MAGTAILDPNVLVDGLVADVIDGLREDLHPQFGVRAYRVFTVLRTWSGAYVGDGDPTEVVAELRPQPLVHTWDGLRWGLEACGLNEMGEIKLTEVSLTYTEAELAGGALAANQQWLIRVTEAHGQASSTRNFVHVRPPYVDRIRDMGWVLWLRSVE
jgi:hypothetical protein